MGHADLQALKAQGHTVECLNDVLDAGVDMPDLVIGPHAWYMTEVHIRFLDLAIAAARKVAYPKGE